MELAAIITTLVVVLLQIITLSIVLGTRKMVHELNSQKSNASNHGDRRDRDFRHNRRPSQDNRPKAQPQGTTTTAAVDPVEKSLRDINLKLKNAERDQEFARKKMHDGNFSKDQNNRRRDGGRGGRDYRSRDRDNRGNDRRGNWNDRNRRDNNAAPNGNVNPDAEERFEIKSIPETQVQEIQATTAAPDIVPSDFGSGENMQHGRKFGDKRRMYTSEAKTENDSPSVVAEPVQDSQVQQVQEEIQPASEETTTEGTEIKFGRR
ncbi:MAG: hypothetical protein GX556_05610 [Fibrobacter sp.]|nr:hypothetical protein [Fibrobacter sp.]